MKVRFRKKAFGAVAIFLIFALLLPNTAFALDEEQLVTADLNYTETVDAINNPDRGFYKPFFTKYTISGNTVKNPSGNLLHMRLGIGAFSSNNNTTLTEDEPLSDDMLSALDGTLANLRANGGRAIIRFAYDNFYGNANKEPAMNMVLHHISQLSPIFHKYEDVIVCVETGMLGPWGEQHTSTIARSLDNYTLLINAFLDAVPESRTISVRRPTCYAHWLGINVKDINTLGVSEPSTDAYRVGVYNDGYLGSTSDLGTYASREKEVSWLSSQASHTVFGGEVVTDADGSKTNSPEFMAYEMFRTHTTYLNSEWNDTVIKTWKNSPYIGDKNGVFDELYDGQSAYTYINNHMGYRYVLRESKLPSSASAGGSLRLTGIIENVGCGNLVNEKTAELILEKGEESAVIPVNLDARTWASRQSTSYDVSVNLPDNLSSGEWSIYLRLREPGDNAEQNVIRFANVDIWNAYTKSNLLGNVYIQGNGAAQSYKTNYYAKITDRGGDIHGLSYDLTDVWKSKTPSGEYNDSYSYRIALRLRIDDENISAENQAVVRMEVHGKNSSNVYVVRHTWYPDTGGESPKSWYISDNNWTYMQSYFELTTYIPADVYWAKLVFRVTLADGSFPDYSVDDVKLWLDTDSNSANLLSDSDFSDYRANPTGYDKITGVGNRSWFTYSTATMQVAREYIPLNEPECSKGVWWWYASDVKDTAIRDSYLDFLESEGVSEIYMYADNMGGSGASFAQMREFVRLAGQKGMRVAYLGGDVSWINNGSSGFPNALSRYESYQNEAAENEKFYGIHLDVEPHQSDDWDNPENRTAVLQLFADNFLSAVKVAKESGTVIELDIQCGLEDYTVSFEDNSVPVLSAIISSCNTLSLMSYRDTASAMFSFGEDEFALAKEAGCKVTFGAETGTAGEGDFVDYYDEDKTYLNEQLDALYSILLDEAVLPESFGFAVHHVRSWYKLPQTRPEFHSIIANYSEGGCVNYPASASVGDTVTVSAVGNQGFILTPGSLTVNGVVLDSDTFIMPDKNVRITAEFEPIGPKIDITAVGGSVEYSVSGAVGSTLSSTDLYGVQDAVCNLTASAPEGSRFLYWVNTETNRIVSTDYEYSFNVVTDAFIEAVFCDTASGVSITYTSFGGNILSQASYTEPDSHLPPDAPDFMGMSFKGWVLSESVADDRIYRADYELSSASSYTVSITNTDGSVSGAGEYSAFETVTISADGDNFSYWANSSGEVVSYERGYSFCINYSETFTAVYDGEVAAVSVSRITSHLTSQGSPDDEFINLTFFAERSVPSSCEIIQTGIIVTRNATVGASDSTFIIGADRVGKGTSLSTECNGTYSLTVTNWNGTDVVYARPYIIVRTPDGVQTVYGGIYTTN